MGREVESGIGARGARGSASRLIVFFATDLHGSETCFRKFLMAPRLCGADVLVLGGDIVGRSLIPITRMPDGYRAEIDGRMVTGLSTGDLKEVKESIRRRGGYFVIGDADELGRLSDPDEFRLALHDAMRKSLEDWVTLAEERLCGTGVRCLVIPAGEDPLELDSVWSGAENVIFAGDRVLSLDDSHELLALSCSTPTPFKHPREVSELEMRGVLDALADEVSDLDNALVVAHTPPYGSVLDQAPLLDENLRRTAGTVVAVPVGSIAVRDFVEHRQPLVAAHGQVHERSASCRIGRTLCINPGSQASEGLLSGALVELGDRTADVQMLVGR